MKKNINRITILNFLSVALLQGLSLITSPLFSRLLDTDGYGNLASFSSWVSIISTVLSLQSSTTIVNARQEFPQEEQPRYQSSVMCLSMLSFGVGGGVLLAFSGVISARLCMDFPLLVMILAQAFGSFCVGFLSCKYTYEFQAERNLLLSVLMALANFGVSLLLVLNLPQEQRYFGRVLGNVLVYGVVGLVSCLWILRRGRTFYQPRYWKFCLMLGCPLVFQNLAYSVLGNSDILMLKQMAGAADSGIYNLASTMTSVLFTLFTALNSSWVPFFFDDMKQGRRENAARQGRNFLEIYTVLSVGFILLAREVFQVYAKESFWPGIALLPIFTANYYGNMLCTFPVNYEVHHKKTVVVAVATVIAAVLNVALNYWLIGLFGMVGAALATLFARIVQLLIHVCYVRLHLNRGDYPFPAAQSYIGCAAVALAAVLFYALPNAWYIRWSLGAALGAWELYRMYKRRGLL